MDEQTKRKELHPRKLSPPPEAAKRIQMIEKSKTPNNRLIRFFYLFLGEGL